MLNETTTENLHEFLDYCEINNPQELIGNGIKISEKSELISSFDIKELLSKNK